MGKEKRDKDAAEGDETIDAETKLSYEELCGRVSVIARPLASRKLAKRLYKLTKKARQVKMLRKGIREVQKFIRKGERGLVVFAGDTNPVEVICHMPIVCEESNIAYCYTPSKEDLGGACGSRRPTCVVMIKSHEDYRELYEEVQDELQKLPAPL